MKIGSLFSGGGALDEGVRSVLGGEVAWHSEVDPGACAVLDYRYPGVPNLGDVSLVDWSEVEPVDMLTGGFPCTDLSLAGARAGLKDGTRSGLWSQMLRAIVALQPGTVVIENVRGLLSAKTDGSGLEFCAWCMGDVDPDLAVRALGCVLGDLADAGFDACWAGLRAADVGAPHGRFRIFILAWPVQDTDRAAGGERRVAAPAQAAGGRTRPDTGGSSGMRVAADATSARDGGNPGVVRVATEATGGQRAHEGGFGNATVSDSATPPDAVSCGLDGRAPDSQRREVGGTAAERSGERTGATTDTDRRLSGPIDRDGESEGNGPGLLRPRVGGDVAWGPYEPAILRWESVLGRVAPPPTEPGPKGAPRLSPAFTNWLMGWPDGWVTDPAIWRGWKPSAARNTQLKICGNGVVPQQAAEALRRLIAVHANIGCAA